MSFSKLFRRTAYALAITLALTCSAYVTAHAQQSPACAEGRITSVLVDNHSVFDMSDPDLDGRFSWAFRLANRIHIRTRDGVIRRELLFAEGDCYDVAVLRDSERILRGARFIADVDIYGIRQPDGDVHVIVDTQDEWSLRMQPEFAAGGSIPSGLLLREDNLLGTGRHISVYYLEDRGEQVYGFSYMTPQLFQTRWDARMQAAKTPTGYLLAEALTYPFLGETGRWALRQSVQHTDHYFIYADRSQGELREVLLPERRRTAEAAFAFRWRGSRENRTLIGAGMAAEWVSYPEDARFADEDLRRERVPIPIESFGVDSLESVRLMLLAGQRNVYFVRRRALDTVNGTEDVRLGVQAEAAIGPALSSFSRETDLALSLGFFAAGEPTERLLLGTDLSVQGHRNADAAPSASEWDDVFAELDAWAYWRLAEESSHLLVGGVSLVGGWHTRVPFQLTLGERTGLRGFERNSYPAARRIVASLEHRAHLGWPLPQLFDLGTATFVDAGRGWAGSVPFGENSSTLVSVGAGLRAAFPPGSRQTLRVDIGFPVVGGDLGDFVVSIGMGQLVGQRAGRLDSELARSLRSGVSTSLFVFPN